MSDEVKRIDVGVVTAFAEAKRAATPYPYDRKRFRQDLANLGTTAAEVEANRQEVADNTQAVADDKAAVAADKASAAQSAAAAAQSAENAHTDALAATEAKEAAQAAQGIAVEAKEAAASARTAAENARTEADASAEAAAESALAAQNAATTATTQAGAASDSATAAAQSAAAAAESARTLTIDTTLTQAGQAADAKKAGDEVTDLKSALTTETSARQSADATLQNNINAERTRAQGEESRIEELFSMPTQEAVNNWLDEHPEATTTVEDESLIYKKLIPGTLGFVTPEMFGSDGTALKDQPALEAAVISGNIVVLSQGKTYYISDAINVPDGVSIYGNGAIISKTNPSKIGLRLSGNNVIDSLTIDGNNGIAASPSEYWHNFNIKGSNVKLTNCHSINANGDGYYVNGDNFSIVNCDANNPSRNGLSIINCDGLLVDNCTFRNATTLNPMLGIDLETNLSTEKVCGTIRNVYTSGNLGGSIALVTTHTSNLIPWNMTIENIVSDEDGDSSRQTGNFALSIVAPLSSDSNIIIDNYKINNVKSKALYVVYASGIENDCSIKINNLIINGCAMNYPITLLTNTLIGVDIHYFELSYHIFNRANNVDYDILIGGMSSDNGRFDYVKLIDIYKPVSDVLANNGSTYTSDKNKYVFNIPKNSSKTIEFEESCFACFIFAQGSALSLYGSWILQGYGPGDTRYHLQQLQANTTYLTATISGKTLVISNTNTSSDCIACVVMEFGAVKSMS